MAQELFSFIPTEVRRLMWIVGMLFALVLVFQHVELPYGSHLSSVLSAKPPPVEKNSTLQASEPASYRSVTNRFDDSETSSSNRTSALVSNGNKGSLELDEEEDDSGSLIKENATLSDLAPVGSEAGNLAQDNNTDITLSKGTSRNESSATDPGGILNAGFPIASPAYPPVGVETDAAAPIISVNSNVTLVERDKKPSQEKLEKDSSVTRVPAVVKKVPEAPILDVYTISDMNKLLCESEASYRSVIPRWSSSVDQEIQDVAAQIKNAPIIRIDPHLYGPLYLNVFMFKRSYDLMESTLKVYVYSEGERPIMHTPGHNLQGISASEGWFMKQMEDHKRFVTKDPKKGHLYYLPFSSRTLEEKLYAPNSHSRRNLVQYLKDYVDLISGKYPFWIRTGGADHFLVACHDWAADETKRIMGKCIRSLCNADMKESFLFGKDVTLPETYIKNAKSPLRDIGGNRPSKRSILMFFAGSMHGYVRPILLQHWENKDPDMKIFGKLPKSKGNMNYVRHTKSSKYCICAKGYEVNSPRVVEAIFYECVPVIISDNFIPPFFEILNWETFAVFVMEKDIPNLKNILLSIPVKRYQRMKMRVKRVQQHFLWHAKPEKYDIFHMILHSIWHNRLHQIKPR